MTKKLSEELTRLEEALTPDQIKQLDENYSKAEAIIVGLNEEAQALETELKTYKETEEDWRKQVIKEGLYLEQKRKIEALETELKETDFLLANIPEKGKELFKENERLKEAIEKGEVKLMKKNPDHVPGQGYSPSQYYEISFDELKSYEQ